MRTDDNNLFLFMLIFPALLVIALVFAVIDVQSQDEFYERNKHILPHTPAYNCPDMPDHWVNVTEQWVENRSHMIANPSAKVIDLPYPYLVWYVYLKDQYQVGGFWYASFRPIYQKIDGTELVYAGWYLGTDKNPHPSCGVWITS